MNQNYNQEEKGDYMLVKNLTTINEQDGDKVAFELYGSNILLDRFILGKNNDKNLRAIKIESTTIKTKRENDLYQKWYEIFKNILREYFKSNKKVLRRVDVYASEYARNMISTFSGTVGAFKISTADLANIILGMKSFIKKVSDNSDNDVLTTQFNSKLMNSFSDFIDSFKKGGIILPEAKQETTIIGEGLANIKNEYSKAGCKIVQVLPISVFSQGIVGDKIEFDSSLGAYYPEELFDRLGHPEFAEEWHDDLEEIFELFPQGLRAHILSSKSLEEFENEHFEFAGMPDTSFTASALQKAGEGFVKAKVKPSHDRWHASPYSVKVD